MLKTYFKNFNTRFLITCCVILGIVIIIHSCKKDNAVSADSIISDARNWYESTYPATNTSKNFSAFKSSTDLSSLFDFTQHIKPDWNHAAAYSRFGAKVVELPMDPSVNFSTDFRNVTNNKVIYKKEHSRTSFLLLNDGKNYTAYIMTVIADSAYVGNDLSKLAHNTYRKHDADFSGVVIYSTPKGQFIRSYGYKNGKIVPATAPGPALQQNNNPVFKSKALALAKTTATTKTLSNQVPVTNTCMILTIEYYEDGVLVYISRTILSCSDNSGGGIGTSPTACPPGVGMSAHFSGRALAHQDPVGGAPPPDDPGFPDPSTSTTISCAVVTTVDSAATDSVAKLVKGFCDGVSTADQQQIMDAITTFKTENCVQAGIFKLFVTRDSSFTFCISSNSLNAGGTSIVVTGNIGFPSAATIISTMDEELFHQYQNMVYPGGINQYGTNGRADIEFEAAFFEDIVSHQLSTNGMYRNSQSEQDAYSTWIAAITNNYTTYPKSVSAIDLTQYLYYLGLYSQTHPEYNAPLNLTPQAVLAGFSNYSCNN